MFVEPLSSLYWEFLIRRWVLGPRWPRVWYAALPWDHLLICVTFQMNSQSRGSFQLVSEVTGWRWKQIANGSWKNVRRGCQKPFLGLMWDTKKEGLSFSILCSFFFLFILWVLSFLSRKTVPVKLMFWQGFSSQNKSNSFFLYVSTAFYKAPFTCFDTTVFNRKQLLPPWSPPRLLWVLGGFALPSAFRAVVWGLQVFCALFCAPKSRGGKDIFSG